MCRQLTWAGRSLSRSVAIAAAIIASGLAAPSALAQSDYPRRPITLIVPFAAGGPTDVIARIAGEHMSRTLGQQLIVENIVGAGGTTASTRAMRAQPDGYTIEMGHMGTHAASVALYPNLAYKPDVDFGALQRHGPGAHRPDRRPGRLHVRPDRQRRAAGPVRTDQGLRDRDCR